MPAPETKRGSALRGLSPGGLNPAPRRLKRRASWPRPGSRAPRAPEPASAEKIAPSAHFLHFF